MGRRKLTRILLEIGINPALRNKQAETALDIAVRKNLAEIVTILSAGPPPPTRPPLLADQAAKPAGGPLPQHHHIHSAGVGVGHPPEGALRSPARGGTRHVVGLPSLSDCDRIEQADMAADVGSSNYQRRSTAAIAAPGKTARPLLRPVHSGTTSTDSTQPSSLPHAHAGGKGGHRHVRYPKLKRPVFFLMQPRGG